MSAEGQEAEHSRRAEGRERPAHRRGGSDGLLAEIGLRRPATALLGGVLLVRGLRRGRTIRGMATAALGGWLLSRAVRRIGDDLDRSSSASDVDVEPALQQSRRDTGPSPTATEFSRSVTVDAPADELYDYWTDPDQLSRIVGHFATVTTTEDDRFHWTVPGRFGVEFSWESRLTVDESGEVLRWETLPGADVPNEGSVQFRPAPGDQGTEVEMTVRFDPPGGRLGSAALSALDVVPRAIVANSMRRFKSLAETGEIPTLEANPSARSRGDLA